MVMFLRFIFVLFIATNFNIYVVDNFAVTQDNGSTSLHGKSRPILKIASEVKAYADTGRPSMPRDLQALLIKPTYLKLTWNPPEFWNGPGDGYILIYNNLTVPHSRDSSIYFVAGLKPWTEYMFVLHSYNKNEYGEMILSVPAVLSVTTCMDAPSSPRDLTVTGFTSESISVAWSSPLEPNGPLTGYVVADGLRNFTLLQANSYTFNHLLPWNEYTISVLAFNKDSDGILKSPLLNIIQMTEVGKPSACENLRISGTTCNSTVFQWDRPTHPSGPIDGYILSRTSDGLTPITQTVRINYVRILNLDPSRQYNLSVKAFNKHSVSGDELISDPATMEVTTRSREPGKVNDLRATAITSTTIKIEWSGPDLSCGPVSGYILTHQTEDMLIDDLLTDLSFTLTELQPWTDYTIYVRAFGMDGERKVPGPVSLLNIQTSYSAPGPVLSLRISNTTRSSLTIQWEIPQVANGPVSGYTVYFGKEGERLRPEITKETETSRTGLNPWTNYTFDVAAYNEDETHIEGPSVSVTARTASAEPGPPESATVQFVKDKQISVTWTRPLQENGPINGYYLFITSPGYWYEEATNANEYIFEDLKPFTDYNISIHAYNELHLIGPPVLLAAKTLSSVPPFPLNITTVKIEKNSLVIKAPNNLFSEENGPIEYWALLVAANQNPSQNPRSGERQFKNTTFLSYQQAQNTKYWYKASPDNWKLMSDDGLCGTFDSSNRECFVGTERTCSIQRFCNGILTKNTWYSVKIRAYTRVGYSETWPLTFKTSGASWREYSQILTLFVVIVSML